MTFAVFCTHVPRSPPLPVFYIEIKEILYEAIRNPRRLTCAVAETHWKLTYLNEGYYGRSSMKTIFLQEIKFLLLLEYPHQHG